MAKSQIIVTTRLNLSCLIIAIAFFFGGYYCAGKFNKERSKDKYGAAQDVQKKHEKEIKTIRTESDSAAVLRFRENFGTRGK